MWVAAVDAEVTDIDVSMDSSWGYDAAARLVGVGGGNF